MIKNNPESSIFCGTPSDFYIRVNGKRWCPHCYELRDALRNCNLCGMKFTPKCGVRHRCNMCHMKLRFKDVAPSRKDLNPERNENV